MSTTSATPATRQRGRWAASVPTRPHLGERLVAWPDYSAFAVAMVFWLVSLTPTLLPRTALVQAVLSSIITLIGYGIGGLVLRLFRLQRHWTGWFTPSDRATSIGRRVVLAGTVLLATLGTFLWWRWQNEQRSLLGMTHLGARAMINFLVIALVLWEVILIAARLVDALVGWVMATSWRWTGPYGARAIGTVFGLVLVLLAYNQLIVNGIYSSVHASFEAGNLTTDPGTYQPTSTDQSGGPGSLTPWSTLGLQGRNFAGGATSLADLQQFAGPGVTVSEPIRVYAGLDSAPTPEARAALAVRELERDGGFSRPVLVVATATGTGWINPYASAAVEYLWHGDSAIVSMQYSFLPSWIGFLTERGSATNAGRALYDAVYAHWRTLPAAHRPRLVVFGESLGSFGAESGFAKDNLSASLNVLSERSTHALFVGPTEGNPVWRQVLAGRTGTSPVWRATIANDQVIVSNSASQITTSSSGAPLIQYVAHGTDPVTWFGFSTIWWPPQWITGPSGPGVPSNVIWFPIATWVQTVADLMAGFSTPVGYGHNYNNVFAQGFSSIAAPPGWTTHDTQLLAQRLERLNEGVGTSSGS